MNKQKNSAKANVCLACSCPCEMHKEHNHQAGEDKADGGSAAKVCEVCGSSDKNCGCK